MDINDKSTALVSVSDLSAVLQGVKRYIDSSKPNVSWDELASSKTAYIPVELTWNEDEKLYIGNIWHNTSKVRVNGVEYDCPSFDFMGRPGYGNGNIAAWESNGFPFSYANFADGQVLVACKGNDSFLPINTFEFIVEQSSLCPQDYVESSLGNNTLRDDIKALSEKKPDVSWDDLYGGERIIHCDTFEKRTGGVSGVVSVIPLSTPVVMDADGNITPDLPSKFYIKNLHFERGTYHENGSEDLSADFLNSCNRYGDGVIELSGYGEYVAELDNNLRLLIGMMPSGVVEFEDGSFQLNSLAFMIDAMDYNETERLCTFDFIEKSEASPCPPSYVASSIGNESLEEDIKFLKENSGKVTIDGLVKQEFGEVVSTEYYGMTMQGILTNIPAQEGVSFKLSNIHYEDDIHFYDTSLSEGTPEAVYAKDDANRVMHYPTELSGVLEYHQGALGYSEEFDSTGLHALVDFGLGYMVYVDNFGFELSLKPLISYPLKLEVSSLISPDYVESSIGNSSLREDIEFLKENGGSTTWDKLYSGSSVHCNELGSLELDGDVMSEAMTKIPLGKPYSNDDESFSVRLKNIVAVRDYYNNDGHLVATSDTVNSLLDSMGARDAVFDKSNKAGLSDGAAYYVYPALGDSPILMLVVVEGSENAVLGIFNNDDRNQEPLFECDVVLEDDTPCNPDYVDSSLGKANLREDLESLHLGKTTKWVDTMIVKTGSTSHVGSVAWNEAFLSPKAIRFTLDGVYYDSESNNNVTFERSPEDYYGNPTVLVRIGGNIVFFYLRYEGKLLARIYDGDDYDEISTLELKVEICNTISSEFVANMPYIGYNTISSGITEVEPNVTGLPYEKGLKLDATTFSGAISVNGEVFDITMTSGDGTLFGNIEILSGSYKEGDVPYVGMIGLDDDGKVLVIVGSMKPISSVEFLQKEWRRKLPKEAIEGDCDSNTTWDELAGVQETSTDGLVHCDELVEFNSIFPDNPFGTKIPLNGAFDPQNPRRILLRNIHFVRGLYNSDGTLIHSADDLNGMLGGKTEFETRYIGLTDGAYEYALFTTSELDGNSYAGRFLYLYINAGETFGCLTSYRWMEDRHDLLLTCDVDVSDYDKVVATPCDPSYVDSSLGNENLKEDLARLSEKTPTWDELYGIKRSVVTYDELVTLQINGEVVCGTKVLFDAPFDASNPPLFSLDNVRAVGTIAGMSADMINSILSAYEWNVVRWNSYGSDGNCAIFDNELASEATIYTKPGLGYGVFCLLGNTTEEGKFVYDVVSVSQKTHLEHCTGYRSDAGTVIPLSEPFSIGNAPTIRLKDITFLHDYYSDNHRLIYTREQLVQLLGNNKDFVCSVWETGSNLVDGAYMCDIPAEDGSVFMRVLAMTGLPQAYIQMAGDAFVGGRLIDCYVEVGEGYKLCPSEYIASPLGSASLKADVEMLQRKLSKVLQALQYATFTQDVSGILGDL